MPALASHRKSRTRTGVRANTPAVGFTTAALASVTLLSTQSATAAPAEPKPSVEEVQKKVDDLYRQAGTATQEYNKAKEATDTQRRSVDRVLDDVAKSADKVNEARRALGTYAAAQYRAGAVGPTAALMFADSPESYFEQTQLMGRLTDRQQEAVEDFQKEQRSAAKQRVKATKSLETLTESQASLKAGKQKVQNKLAAARSLLADLTAEEKARLAALERKKEEEARRKAEAKAKAEAAERKRQEEARQEEAPATGGGTDTGSGGGSGVTDGTYAAKAEKVLAFARAQIGKPYVWGATGPSSYDCSGLTGAAWKEAGVQLPRTTWDQVKVGKRVATADLLPGDLVFFYDDISHVGIYKGDGKMIHAPKPGANVREESIYYMPIYGSVRPA
ncbi:NlpC/P60 family protein [Streptomyces sp. NBC_00838]|uniref:C40 family peptidase n=1 Tax=Streptomyces sp. NBC_00838 TaxID=2903680 RepID=UPI003870C837|nr:NlpC/P60 family protein [Streptomyces sp. NBC_00838]